MQWRKKRIFFSILLVGILIVTSLLYKSKNYPLNTVADISEIPIYSVDRGDRAIALTFDINWTDKDNIYSILDTLEKYNIKGTFFIIGYWVTYSEENISKLKAIAERGNEIGNHSYKHPSFSNIGEEKILEELEKTDEVIEEYTGIKPKLFRFPSGDYNIQSYRSVVKAGYIPIQWDVDSVDWKELGADIEYKRVKDNIKPGSIVLFHNNAKYTPDNLEKLILELNSENYEFLTVGELIHDYSNSFVDKNGVQHKK